MDIQSLSVVVPNKECMNKCPFCVSRMVNSNIYPNLLDINHPMYDYNVKNYMDRLEYVAKLGCSTLMLTGTSEPQQNKQFLNTFAFIHKTIGSPFKNIEMQTTGVLLDKDANYLRFLRNFVNVNTIAISLNSVCEEMNNRLLVNYVNVKKLCQDLKNYGFNIRICCNLSKLFDLDCNPWENIFKYFKDELYADQVTLRTLYASEKETAQSTWIAENFFDTEQQLRLASYMKCQPTIGRTMYGAVKYSIMGMSVICDTDCMGKNAMNNTLKYLILRPNCHLYSQWDSPASLVF